MMINVGTVNDLENSFVKVYLSNGRNGLWAVDTIEYEFYNRREEIEEFEKGEKYIRALRLLYGPKQTKW